MNGKIRAGLMGVFLVYLVKGCLVLPSFPEYPKKFRAIEGKNRAVQMVLVKFRAMNGKIRAGWMGVFLVYLVQVCLPRLRSPLAPENKWVPPEIEQKNSLI